MLRRRSSRDLVPHFQVQIERTQEFDGTYRACPLDRRLHLLRQPLRVRLQAQLLRDAQQRVVDEHQQEVPFSVMDLGSATNALVDVIQYLGRLQQHEAAVGAGRSVAHVAVMLQARHGHGDAQVHPDGPSECARGAFVDAILVVIVAVAVVGLRC